jgi:Ca2+-binding RTX toxin-like protein
MGATMANIPGDNNANNLVGTNNDDEINARGGNDTVTARDGDDFVQGGNGADRISGQDDDDTLLGDGGADNINGGEGDDGIDGGGGGDFVQGGPGNDSMTGGPGQDTFFVNPDDEFETIIDFTKGDDTISINGFSQIKNFGDLTIDFVNNNSVIDLGDIENGTPGQQVLTILDEQGLAASDFDFPAGPILVAKNIAVVPQGGEDGGEDGGEMGGGRDDGGNGQPPPAEEDDRGRGDDEAGEVMGVQGVAPLNLSDGLIA